MRDGPTDATLGGAVLWRPIIASWLGDVILPTPSRSCPAR
jgi:hypothetical protein